MTRTKQNPPVGGRGAQGAFCADIGVPTDSRNRHVKQDLLSALIRAEGPRERRPSWPHWSGNRPARAGEIDDVIRANHRATSAIGDALRRALTRRGRA